MYESGDEMERFKKLVKRDNKGKTLETVLVDATCSHNSLSARFNKEQTYKQHTGY